MNVWQIATGEPGRDYRALFFDHDIRIIAAHDNFVAINNALTIDLTGRSTAETLGTRQLGSAGGQIPFCGGAWLPKGGRLITVLLCNCMDYVVTEYGIAWLKGKTLRQRTRELIAMAHPDFRAELKKEAQELSWP